MTELYNQIDTAFIKPYIDELHITTEIIPKYKIIFNVKINNSDLVLSIDFYEKYYSIFISKPDKLNDEFMSDMESSIVGEYPYTVHNLTCIDNLLTSIKND